MKRNTMCKYLSVNSGYSSSESISFKWFITPWRNKFILNINITKNTLTEKFDGLEDRECFFIKYIKFSGNMKQKHLIGFDSKKEILDYISVLKSNPLKHYSSGHYVVEITGMPLS